MIRNILSAVVLLIAVGANNGFAQELLSASSPLVEKYNELESELKTSPLGMPVHIESYVGSSSSHVDIYGTVKYPFEVVKSNLQAPSDLCDVLMLTINIRACTYEKKGDDRLITAYSVKKYYNSIDDAFPIKFKYLASKRNKNELSLSLAADRGPFNTKDHQFEIEAIPLDEGTTFISLHYLFDYNLLGYFTIKSYFELFGGSRVGFTVTSINNGKPSFVTGLRGAVERNVMRYYLAILAHLNATGSPSMERYDKELTLWYDLTTKYKKQLFELDKEDYLAYKRNDERMRLKLQKMIKNSG